MSYIEVNNQYKPAQYRFRFYKNMAAKGPKKLFSSLLEHDESEVLSDDTIKVYLRLKPTQDHESKIMRVLDTRTVVFKMPAEFNQFKKKLNVPDEFKYTFSNIYQEDVGQGEIFTGCVAPLVKDLFLGQNCLLFTYGTTNAGKTFTVLGNGDHPGIIPRTLTTVFKSIKGKEYGSARIMPDLFNAALEMTDADLEEDQKFKKKILCWSLEKSMYDQSRFYKTTSTTSRPSDDYMGETEFREMQKRLTNDISIVEYQAEPHVRFSVWVSFGEIYNENIYDLLMPIDINRKRKALKLAQDKNRNTYIKGLKHVFVQSEEEAYKVLMFGKNNLQVAATGMNLHSSRSHCIFTIKLIKILDVENPEKVVVSSFSICDLAGAERQKKTLNVGLRLKESQNINCSLHVLSRCFNVIRENQLHGKNELIPFRDSKLTQLFQHALMGKENVTMIVNVNQEKHLCEETQHVLKATAVAKHIVVQPRMVPKPSRMTRTSLFSQIISKHNRSTLIRWDSCVKPKVPECVNDENSEHAESQLEEKEEQYETLLCLVETLKEKLETEKTKHLETKKLARLQEDKIREEMRKELDVFMKTAKEDNKYMKEMPGITAEGESVKSSMPHLPIPTKRMKIDDDLDSKICASDENKELLEEIKTQKIEINGFIDLVNILHEEKKQLTMELTSTKMQLGWKDQEIDCLKNKIETFGDEGGLKAAYIELEKEMEEKLKRRDNLLEEARSELLDEIAQKEEVEADWVKLDKELIAKEDENLRLQSINEDMLKEISSKTELIEKLEKELNFIEEGFNEERNEFEDKIKSLENELRTQLSVKVSLEATREEVENLRSLVKMANVQLEEKVLKVEELEQILKNKNSEKIDSSKEISVLEQSLKQQIQETTRVMSLNVEKSKEAEQFSKELGKAKTIIENLSENLKSKEHELNCVKNKIIGYENSFPALEAEFKKQRQELLEYKTRYEQKVEAFINKERELETFQSNQKEIIGKYEQQLKKTKDENEVLKKEVAKVTHTFNQLTPTPKKDLEKQVEELKKKLSETKKENEHYKMMNQTFKEDNEKLSKQISGTNKENERGCFLRTTFQDDMLRNQYRSKALQTNAVEGNFITKLRSKSVSTKHSAVEENASKSASKIRTRRTRAATSKTDVSDSDNDLKVVEKPAKPIRRKLLDTTCKDTDLMADDDEVNIPQLSPGSMVRRNLRSRLK